ncbi:MAG: hypothetical protein ACLS45_05010, partial [Subdoligranulum sp.]
DKLRIHTQAPPPSGGGVCFYSKTAPPAIWYYPRAVLLFLFDKENENGVSNGVLTKDAFF